MIHKYKYAYRVQADFLSQTLDLYRLEIPYRVPIRLQYSNARFQDPTMWPRHSN